MLDADASVHDAMGAALDARASETLSSDAVRALWESVRGRSGT